MARRYMLDVCTAYEQQGKASVLTPGVGEQLQLYAVHLLNRCGAAQDMGVFIKQNSTSYKFGIMTAPATVVDATSAIQAGTAQNLFTTVSGDGYLVQCKRKFGMIGFAISQTQGAGAPTYTYSYFNGAAYVALPDILTTPVYTAAGDQLLVFTAPRDWVVGSTAGVGGDAAMYSILAVSGTAPAQAVKANDIWVGKMLDLQTQVPNNAQFHTVYEDTYPRELDSLEGLLPYFGTADPRNVVTAKYFSHG